MSNVPGLKKALNEWLDADDKALRGDARIVTKAEWKERGETVGTTSSFTLVIDGSPLYAALNYGEPSWKIQEKLMAMAESYGFYYELGYGWAIHFYEA